MLTLAALETPAAMWLKPDTRWTTNLLEQGFTMTPRDKGIMMTFEFLGKLYKALYGPSHPAWLAVGCVVLGGILGFVGFRLAKTSYENLPQPAPANPAITINSTGTDNVNTGVNSGTINNNKKVDSPPSK
jgi:hypothetical protein